MLELEKQYIMIEKLYRHISNLKVPDDAEKSSSSYEKTPPDLSENASPIVSAISFTLVGIESGLNYGAASIVNCLKYLK
jgi:hypothetical protein